jgi:hypothetical protein
MQKQIKKAATDEEKLIKKAEKEQLVCKYGYALIDGRMEKMGNYNMEPPGLFRGRGEHPKTGKVKERCFAESVSINCSEDAPIPIASVPGHAWSRVQHDNTVTWLCGWNENVQQQNKYVMLSASSTFKQTSDQEWSNICSRKEMLAQISDQEAEQLFFNNHNNETNKITENNHENEPCTSNNNNESIETKVEPSRKYTKDFLKDNSFLHLKPHMYIFHGAEVSLKNAKKKSVVVGCDGRYSSPILKEKLIQNTKLPIIFIQYFNNVRNLMFEEQERRRSRTKNKNEEEQEQEEQE